VYRWHDVAIAATPMIHAARKPEHYFIRADLGRIRAALSSMILPGSQFAEQPAISPDERAQKNLGTLQGMRHFRVKLQTIESTRLITIAASGALSSNR